MGTGLRIAAGLCITARHVVDECLRIYQGMERGIPGEKEDAEGTFHVDAFQFWDGETSVRWSVKQMHTSAYCDIAYLHMAMTWQPPPDLAELVYPAWNLIPPSLGSRIVGFGYPRGQVALVEDSVGVKVSLDPRTTVGEVVEVHLNGRDSLLPFPCFRTNARFDPGMSGGPVFDETGRFCGLICSNMPPSEEGQDHVSYVTLLWPSLEVQVKANRIGHAEGIIYPVYELARDQFLHVNGWERFGISNDGKPFFRWGKVQG